MIIVKRLTTLILFLIKVSLCSASTFSLLNIDLNDPAVSEVYEFIDFLMLKSPDTEYVNLQFPYNHEFIRSVLAKARNNKAQLTKYKVGAT